MKANWEKKKLIRFLVAYPNTGILTTLTFKEVSYAHHRCIYLIKNTVIKKCSCDGEAEFSAAITLVFRNHSYADSKPFFIIINVQNSCAA